MTTHTPARSTLYDADQLEVVIAAMARRTAALLAGIEQAAVIGIRRRGAPLADRICARLRDDHGLPSPLRVDLDIKRYADDLSLLFPQTRLQEDAGEAAVDLAGVTVLLVDDVLYTGHSLLTAIDHLARRQPAQIRVAVLADRCTCRLPVHADIVGVRLQVAPGDIVECRVPPFEPEFGIDLLRKAAAA
ncbi:MAG: phosphoribosyltransferase [Rhodocyclaceae bacterium]|nr:phosphoribosyltransferase [Rhodocyclaceae bacterium]